MKSFRLYEVTCNDIAELSSKYGKSHSDIIETLVAIAHRMCFEESHLPEMRKEDFEHNH